MNAQNRRAKLTLVGLFVIFGLPFFLAWLLHAEQWIPSSTVNHGTLVDPLRPVSATGLDARDAQPLPPGHFETRWTLVFISAAACATKCEEALVKMRQSHLALGKDVSRVQRLFVVPPNSLPGTESTQIQEQLDGVRIVHANEAWLAGFAIENESAVGADRIYLIDPQGFLMMYYNSEAGRKGIHKDLKRLLRVSLAG